jgi:general secretion pathway protein I
MNRRRGFTLLEVLATLVLIGVVLPVAMRGISLSLQTAARARHVAEASQLAQQKIAEVLVVRDAAAFTGTGDFGPDWPEYRWETRGTVSGYGTYEVLVVVTWIEQGVERSVELVTLVHPLTGTDGSGTTDSTTTGGTL